MRHLGEKTVEIGMNHTEYLTSEAVKPSYSIITTSWHPARMIPRQLLTLHYPIINNANEHTLLPACTRPP